MRFKAVLDVGNDTGNRLFRQCKR